MSNPSFPAAVADPATGSRTLVTVPTLSDISVAAPVVVARPRSAHWRARQIELQLKALEVVALNGVRSGVLQIAEATTRPQVGECSALTTLSDQAFVLIARLNTLSAHFMDMEDVTLGSVLAKLDEDLPLIVELQERLVAAGEEEAAQALVDALSPERFRLADANGALFAELNECAATLLSLKCLVATGVQGEASGEWPPAGATPAATKTPPPSRKRAGK